MVQSNQGTLERLFRAAVNAVDPERCVVRHLADRAGPVVLSSRGRTVARLDRGRIWVVAAGKAAVGMARGALSVLGERLAGGVVAAPVVDRRLSTRLRCFSAGHPLPDAKSVAAGRAVWRLLGRVGPSDTVLLLLSGGASSLLALPAPGVSLRDKIRTTEELLRSGAPIGEVNAVRKHLSLLKGGGLARRAGRARVVALLVSDVIGNRPSVIGSGPAAADPTTFAEAWRVLERRGLLGRIPPSVRQRLALGRLGRLPETPKPGELCTRHVVVAHVGRALHAAKAEAESLGARATIVTRALRGDTRAAARRLALLARRLAQGRRSRRPICLLAGGETTVAVRGRGRGGRNQEFALAFALEVAGVGGIAALSAGSDGIDGPTDAAGAFVDSTTVARARGLGLDPRKFLERNDSYGFFRRLGDLFRPGPTGTNVMDLKFVWIGGGSPAMLDRSAGDPAGGSRRSVANRRQRRARGPS